ncbi:MAG: magnesium transporter [Oligoflexales bacterium]
MTSELDNLSAHPSPLLDLRDVWPTLSAEERAQRFSELHRIDAKDFFLSLKAQDQAEIMMALPDQEHALWIRLLPPDDLTDVIQEIPFAERHKFLGQLDRPTRREVVALLAYGEDEAGGLMSPQFARLRPDMTAEEAIRYLKKQAPTLETTRYLYVLDSGQKLLGVVSLRALFAASDDKLVQDIMRTNVVSASDTMSQEMTTALITQSSLMAMPVVDGEGRMKGIVTIDDIVEVVEEEATEDIQRLGGTEVLEAPYLQINIFQMIRKRAGWLIVLFIGEMLTATAMGYFEAEIERAVVLALFIPLIISSGGNSGSQASTLVVRAIALREVRLRDWWRVFSREILVGASLGCILGAIGFLRILFWPARETLYGKHFLLVGVTVACSLMGIVLWGSLAGSMLPFLLKKAKLDPATASAPFVATLVDVSGLVIYFTVASIILKGSLL